MNVLEGHQLAKRFGDREVLSNVSIGISKGTAVAIAGATGSGKSTLLKLLAGLSEADKGIVLFNGKRIEGPATRLIPGHEKIAYLSQYFELRNNYRVEEIFDYSNRLDLRRANELFNICQVQHLLKRRTDEVSGGERQRIALARVLLTDPDVLLLDEPFSNLDFIQKTVLKKVIASAAAAYQLTTVLVSHDPVDILSSSQTVHVMRNGVMVQTGSPQNIYCQPADSYVAGLFGAYTIADEQLRALFHRTDQPIDEHIQFLRPEMFAIEAIRPGSVIGTVNI